MTEALARDKTLTGDTVRVSEANMFWSHGPGKAGAVMVLHGVSRQHFSAWVRLAVAKTIAKIVASVLVSKELSRWQDSRRKGLLSLTWEG